LSQKHPYASQTTAKNHANQWRYDCQNIHFSNRSVMGTRYGLSS
jgi:hypothetical protein